MVSRFVRAMLYGTLFLGRISFSQEKLVPVAVIDFNVSTGLSLGEASVLTSRFRGLLVNTGKFDVVERDRMNEILKQQDFNMSDQCNTAECAVQVGQLLGVQQIIAGDLGQLGETWTIDLRLVDVETGKIMLTRSEDHRGEIDGLLTVMKSIANAFAGNPNSASNTDVSGNADLYILSNPGNFPIQLNGKATGFTTPKLIEGLPIGDYTIELIDGVLAGSASVQLKEGALENVTIDLKPIKTNVKILSNPLGVDVLLEDQKIGVTPCVVAINCGKRKLVFTKIGYKDEELDVEIVQDKTPRTLVVELKSIITVNLIIKPEKSEVIIDGVSYGLGSTVLRMLSGDRLVIVKSLDKSFETYAETISLRADTTLSISLQKKKK